MAKNEHTSLLERDLRHLLRERGWEVIEEKRDRVNLDLLVRVVGNTGVVSLHSAFFTGPRPHAASTPGGLGQLQVQ